MLDPFSLQNGWLAEKKETGLAKWPSFYYENIEKSLKSSDLLLRLESNYKEGKAYRYYKCEFAKEIFYHYVSSESKYFILKTRVTPSQRTSNTVYHVCAIIDLEGKSVLHTVYVQLGFWDVVIM